MRHEPTVIYSAANTQQAHLLKGLLQQEGIAASVVNDAIQMAGGELPMGWTAAARVVVAEENAEAARALAEGFDDQMRRGTGNELLDSEPLSDWPDWPRCPNCGEKRSARCPVCGVSRADFALADLPAAPTPDSVLLKCDDCDDLIRPQWYRLCATCGHDYGDGLQVERLKCASSGITPGLIVVVSLLSIGGTALLAYFAWLLRSGGN